MSRITKLHFSCQWVAGLAGLAAAILLSGCACGGLELARPFSMPSLTPGPVPEGVTISRSGFEGSAFAAVLTVHDQAGETGTARVLEEIAPTLRALGFRRDLSDLAGPAEPLRLEPPDLKALASEVCREEVIRKSRSSWEVCAALRGESPPSDAADAAIRNAYGVGFAEWKAGLERLSFQYPFSQVVEGVPIESAGISAFRRDGESVSLVQGSLFDRYTVVNQVTRKPLDLVPGLALALLTRQLGVKEVPVPLGKPELVLVPDGTARSAAGETLPALRYAWRILVGLPKRPESWMVWIDASQGSLLRVAAQWKGAGEAVEITNAARWPRDPWLCKTGSPSCTESVPFKIDGKKNGKLILALENVFKQLENDDGPELELADSQGFKTNPVQDHTIAVCKSGNSMFRQVNAYSHLYSLWSTVKSAGLVPTFPEKPLRVVIDWKDPNDKVGSGAYYDQDPAAQDASSSLWFADGQGFQVGDCPNKKDARMNGAQDVTVMAHEMSHLFVQRLQERRPPTWCGNAACNMPDSLGHNILHDFADSFAFAYASVDCFAGWTAKNLDGTDKRLHCKGKTEEGGGWPRKAELPQDRFPEHRSGIYKDEYANGQIAAAGLWEVRKGLRSKALLAGTQGYWVNLLRSLWNFGFTANTCSSFTTANGTNVYSTCDRDVFLYLQDLERAMVADWLTAGPGGGQSANKVLSGWAKAGLYLVPFDCLDGKPGTAVPGACPNDSNPEAGLDAVIEIDDQDTGDDSEMDGVVHPEVDYLQFDEPPRFQVWTGPHYRFNGDGTANRNAPLPCGDRFQVELAADPQFGTVWTKGPQLLKPNDPPCWGEVILTPGEWAAAQTVTGSKVYYRARTWDVHGRERLSTLPGGGAFQVAAPFALITVDGKP